jgi:hypothetical protein
MTTWDNLPVHIQDDIVNLSFKLHVDEIIDEFNKNSKVELPVLERLDYKKIRYCLPLFKVLYSKSARINRRYGAYGIKHHVESFIPEQYMTLTECIVLFIILGYSVDIWAKMTEWGWHVCNANLKVKLNYKVGVHVNERDEYIRKLLLKNKVSPSVPRDWDTSVGQGPSVR